MAGGQWCVDNQSRPGIAKPFYPIICMQEWTDRGDSLARSEQDLPDRLPIRPAALPIELSTVCFTPDLVVRWSAVTDNAGRLRKQGSEMGCSAILTAATFKRQGSSHAKTVEFYMRVMLLYQCTISSVVLLSLANGKVQIGAVISLWLMESAAGQCLWHTLREEDDQSYTYGRLDPWDQTLDAAAVWKLRAVTRQRMEICLHEGKSERTEKRNVM